MSPPSGRFAQVFPLHWWVIVALVSFAYLCATIVAEHFNYPIPGPKAGGIIIFVLVQLSRIIYKVTVKRMIARGFLPCPASCATTANKAIQTESETDHHKELEIEAMQNKKEETSKIFCPGCKSWTVLARTCWRSCRSCIGTVPNWVKELEGIETKPKDLEKVNEPFIDFLRLQI